MSDTLSTYGPVPSQLERLKLFPAPMFSDTLELLNLDEAMFALNASPASKAQEFRNLTKAAMVSPTTIEIALQWVVEAQRPHLLEALDFLRLQSPSSPGTTEWLTDLSAQIELGSVSPAMLKDALDQAKGKRLGPRAENKTDWKGTDTESLEKIMGTENSLLPIHFLELALHRAKAVAKIDTPHGAGTGFAVGGNLLVTNAHVLPDLATAAASFAVFNYQKTANGLDAHSSRVTLAPGVKFLLSPENAHDLAVVALAEPPDGRWTEISAIHSTVAKNDRVCIIQHPGGDQKHIGMYHNLVTFADTNIIQYLTDTLPGSSGSPVFDRFWNLVAIHHAGGFLTEPGSKEKLFRNQGIPVAHLLNLLA
jgi:hypothetical protein